MSATMQAITSSAAAGGGAAQPPAGAAANDANGPRPAPGGAAVEPLVPTELFKRSLQDAEALLSHAAQTGRFPLEAPGTKESIKQWVIDGVTNARAAVDNNTLTKGVAGAFWASFADLSRITSPVTAASLRASAKHPMNSLLFLFVVLLVAVLVPLSLFLFVNTSVANQASQLIAEQNSSALRLWSYVQHSRNAANAQGLAPGAPNPPPPGSGRSAAAAAQDRAYAVAAQPSTAVVSRVTPEELFAEVVEFARRNHWLRETAYRLNTFIFSDRLKIDETPVNFSADANKDGFTDLNVSPRTSTLDEIQEAAIQQILMYQSIRNFAQSTLKINTILYNGVTTYLLPALYALLGAALYGLRHYTRLMQQKAYSKSSANSARYFIALIAGIVIGLFGSLLPENLALPPLAVAFLVGYAVEAFFSRLDGVIVRLTRDEAARPVPAAEVPPAQPAAAKAG